MDKRVRREAELSERRFLKASPGDGAAGVQLFHALDRMPADDAASGCIVEECHGSRIVLSGWSLA